MKMMEIPLVERPREKMLKQGRESLSNVELLALLLGNGNKGQSAIEVAMKVISRDSRGIAFLADCTPEELMEVEGIGNAKSCQLLAAVELGKRIAGFAKSDVPVLESSQDVANIFMESLRHYKKEHFICVLIDSKGKIIQEVKVSIGDLTSSTTHPREVFVEAVRRSASSVIFIHNHPSGDPSPSGADIATTKRLVEVGELLGIPVLDHVIIGDGVFTSLRAEGYV